MLTEKEYGRKRRVRKKLYMWGKERQHVFKKERHGEGSSLASRPVIWYNNWRRERYQNRAQEKEDCVRVTGGRPEGGGERRKRDGTELLNQTAKATCLREGGKDTRSTRVQSGIGACGASTADQIEARQ